MIQRLPRVRLTCEMLIDEEVDEAISMEFSSEAGRDDISQKLRLVLKWMTYGDMTIDEMVPDPYGVEEESEKNDSEYKGGNVFWEDK